MRVAFAGKGGAGKTTLAATLARLTAADGRPVLAIDADSNPNLRVALGMSTSEGPATLPASVVSRRLDGPALSEPVADLIERHGLAGPDGLRLLEMGMPAHAEEGCMCSAHATVGAVLADLGEDGAFTVLDLEASPEHFSRGTARHVDVMLLVAEPYYRALETVRRMATLAAELPIGRLAVVANKTRDDQDAEAVGEFCRRHGLELAAIIPWSDAVTAADRERVPLVDHPEGKSVTDAIRRVVSGFPEVRASAG